MQLYCNYLLLFVYFRLIESVEPPDFAREIEGIGEDVKGNFELGPMGPVGVTEFKSPLQLSEVRDKLSEPGPKVPYKPNLVQLLYIKASQNPNPQLLTRAVVVMEGDRGVSGTVHLEQLKSGPVMIFGRIQGLSPGRKFGFHFHEYPVTGNDCETAGEHYNPYDSPHGGKDDLVRHLGDLGNLEGGATGVAQVVVTDHAVSLSGPHSVLGRSLVVHENEDDLGKGRNHESRKSGNSGGRLACGTVVLLTDVTNVRRRTFNAATGES